MLAACNFFSSRRYLPGNYRHIFSPFFGKGAGLKNKGDTLCRPKLQQCSFKLENGQTQTRQIASLFKGHHPCVASRSISASSRAHYHSRWLVCIHPEDREISQDDDDTAGNKLSVICPSLVTGSTYTHIHLHTCDVGIDGRWWRSEVNRRERERDREMSTLAKGPCYTNERTGLRWIVMRDAKKEECHTCPDISTIPLEF